MTADALLWGRGSLKREGTGRISWEAGKSSLLQDGRKFNVCFYIKAIIRQDPTAAHNSRSQIKNQDLNTSLLGMGDLWYSLSKFMPIKPWKWKDSFLTLTGCLQQPDMSRPICRERPSLWGLRQNSSGLVSAQSKSQSRVRPKPCRGLLRTQTYSAWILSADKTWRPSARWLSRYYSQGRARRNTGPFQGQPPPQTLCHPPAPVPGSRRGPSADNLMQSKGIKHSRAHQQTWWGSGLCYKWPLAIQWSWCHRGSPEWQRSNPQQKDNQTEGEQGCGLWSLNIKSKIHDPL